MTYLIIYDSELYHHGIKGQKWGVRRFQNKNGSLKSAGKKRYSEDRKTGGLKSFIKKRADNYENYRNYKRVNEEADSKFNMSKYRENKYQEERSNDAIRQTTRDMFGEESVSNDYNPLGDKYAKAYEKQAAKAKAYVEKKFKEDYGEEKLEQAKKTENFIVGAETAAMILASIGLVVYASR